MWIEDKLKNIWSQIGKSERVAFLSAFAAGMLAHMYVWTNTIPNFDGMSRMYDEQQVTLMGRWFLHYASILHGFIQMPMLIGVLAMLLLGVTAMLVVRLFQIKSPLLAAIWGAIATVFPAMAYTNGYMYTSSAYCLAILMAVVSVYLVKNYRWGWAPGCILLALSMGSYQAYVCVAITLSVLLVLCDMLSEDISWVKAVKNGFRFVFYICGGTVIYYLVLQIFLKVKDLEIWSYLNMNTVEGGYPVDMLGSTILKTYKEVWDFFFVEYAENSFASKWLIFLHVCMALLIVALLAKWIHRKHMWKNMLKLIGTAVLLLLLPMAMNFSQIMSPFSVPSPIMKYAFVFLYFLPILLADMCAEQEKVGTIPASRSMVEGAAENTSGRRSVTAGAAENTSRKRSMAAGLPETLLVVVLTLVLCYFWKYDNQLYTMLNQAHRATLSFVTNVVGRVEGCEGYRMGMKVVIVGGFPSDRYYTDLECYTPVQQGGALSSSTIPLNKHIYYYMNDWLNVPIQEPAEEDFLRIAESEEFKVMPLYPDDGSVRIIDDCVVVKMQETFTPKTQYEKEYENRR